MTFELTEHSDYATVTIDGVKYTLGYMYVDDKHVFMHIEKYTGAYDVKSNITMHMYRYNYTKRGYACFNTITFDAYILDYTDNELRLGMIGVSTKGTFER